MKKEFITLKEGARLSGKHIDTIRSLAKRNPEATTKDSNNRWLIDKAVVLEAYPATSKPASGTSTNEPTNESASGSEAPTTAHSKLIDTLIQELEAKNKLIEQQQQTIQQIVNQQQQLTALTIQPKNHHLMEKTGKNSDKSTPVNPIEGKAKEEKVKKGKEKKGKDKRQKRQKTSFWNKPVKDVFK